MEKNRHGYQVIKTILSHSAARPCNKEEIKAEIVHALGGCDYLSAVIDYLWGACYNDDPAARAAFDELFAADLQEQKPEMFSYFSFHFSNRPPRRGFDRRLENDRREGYSVDICGNVVERRSGRERRGEKEKRGDWTRITEWVSVPFRRPDGEVRAPGGYADDGIAPSSDREDPSAMNLQSLNLILSGLITYFENYMQPGQTAWMDGVDRELFERARQVMGILIEMPTAGRPSGMDSADPKKR